MIVSDKQKELLKKLLPNADDLISGSDALAVLEALDDLYLDLLDEDQEPTVASRECEELRDHIHWANFHKK